MPRTLVHLSAAGVSVLLDVSNGALPAITHWGAALDGLTPSDATALTDSAVEPVIPTAVDTPIRLSVLPEGWRGWMGKPGVEGHRAGADWSPRFTATQVTVDDVPVTPGLTTSGAATLHVEASDPVSRLDLELDVELTTTGVLRARAGLRNQGDDVYDVGAVHLTFPLPDRAREILDFAGRWGKERIPQRRTLGVGIHEREGRRGRTGSDASYLLSVGEPGFRFGRGEVWGLHVGFSGNHRTYAERLPTGVQVVGGGELLLPGEVRLSPGEEYRSPWVYGVYGDGLDAQAARTHRMLRARATHPRRPRPVTLNVWEAVYFDHDEARLLRLADHAADLGIERFVLDDGWFRGRRDDTAGLGDWYVDEAVWPRGLGPLAARVLERGMEFGLWIEPEMVNPDSDLARRHPEWILATGDRTPVLARSQLVLDLARPEAYAYVLGRIVAILEETPVAYLKWDHNRDLVDAGSGARGTAGVHAQTLATYRMLAELKRRFPGLEIESCSSGGGRVDLGVLEHTDRVWASDCIDPLERQQINRWTAQLLPPELIGSHIGSGVSHTTGRLHTLGFRAATAFHWHLGVEWDLGAASATELIELRDWISRHKAVRSLLHSGDMVRIDLADESLHLYGTVAGDQTAAVFVLASVARSEASPRGRFTLRGLDPGRRYRVRPVLPGSAPGGFIPAPWFGVELEGTEMSGHALMTVGLHTPTLFPETAILLEVSAA